MASIGRVVVAIVAAFAGAEHTVAATCVFAAVSTGVVIRVVAIVAGFKARLAFDHIRAHDAVAAFSECAI